MNELGTVQGLAERRGVAFDPTDVRAIRAIQDASAYIRAYTRQQIYPVVTGDVVTLDGPGTRSLLLPLVPVVQVSSVVLIDWDDDETALETTDWRVRRSGILVRSGWSGWTWGWGYGCGWPAGTANIRVTYDHGYETVPEPIASACYDLAEMNYITTGTGAVTSETIDDYSATYDVASLGRSGLSDSVRVILDAYRMPA